jgi:hypothetical protein
MSERFGFGPFPPVPPMTGPVPPITGNAGYFSNWPQGAPAGPDLIAAVGDILSQLQGQSPFAQGAATGPGLPAGHPSTVAGASANVITPLDEQRAAEAFLRDLSAASLRKLYKYLELAAGRQADVAACYPAFHQAVQAYRARDFGQALNACFQVYRMIGLLRSRDLDLPDVPDEAEPDSKPAGRT